MSLDALADQLIDWAVNEPRVRAQWIEGPTMVELRRPYAKLEVHLAADEPDYPGLLSVLTHGFPPLAGARVLTAKDTPRHAKELLVEHQGQRLTLIAEQSFLLAKRPRAAVVPWVDKTGHLPHVLDYSRRAGNEETSDQRSEVSGVQ